MDTAIDTNRLLGGLPGRELPDPNTMPVTPQVTPPPAPPPPPMPAPMPAQAIKVAPTPMPLPPAPAPTAPEFDDDKDLPTWLEVEGKAFSPTNVRSHRGDMRFTAGEPPTAATLEEHPEYAKFAEINGLVGQIRNDKQRREAAAYAKTMEARLRRETDNRGKAAQKAFFDKEKTLMQSADGEGLGVTKAPEINTLIDGYVGTHKQKLEEMVRKGTPQQRQEAEKYLVASPFKTMGDDERRTVARGLLRLNSGKFGDMDATDAARLVYDLATPPGYVDRSKPGKNGYTGRAAADYVPVGVDVLGNHILKTGYGMIRVPSNAYELIRGARLKGYNELVQYEKTLAETRAKEKEPGMIGRAIDSLRGAIK